MSGGEADRPAPPLARLRVLVVEDETLVSFLIEDMLLELGCSAVWHAASVKEAQAILSARRPDAAVLDVNLGGEFVYGFADRLAAEAVPFIFATGYGRGGLPERWADRRVVQKPFAEATLCSALLACLGDPAG
jgi:CheY-like chemotaxis protein